MLPDLSSRSGRSILFQAALFLALGTVLLQERSAFCAPFLRSDVNQDGQVDISDPVAVLLYLFVGEAEGPRCVDAADVNDSGVVDLSDAVYALGFLFLGGIAPPAPFPACGQDPTPDELACGEFPGCGATDPPSGRLVKASECKSQLKAEDTPADQTCLEYAYDDGGTLRLRHLNAGFNCCPIIAAEVKVEGATIRIAESETYDPGPCRCLCLFDLDLEVVNLPPGEYSIEVKEVLAVPEPLVLAVSLEPGAAGSHCLKRDFYPWGL